jgi:hypothetical protein
VKLLQRYRFVLLALTGVILVAATVWTYVGSGDGTRVAGHLGPTPGPSSEGYARSKRAYLHRLTAMTPDKTVAALVSLKRYEPASSVRLITAGMQPKAVFVKLPGADQEALTISTTIAGAVADRATDLRHEIDAEIDDISSREAKAKGAEKAELAALVAQRKKDKAELTADCACVFAVAVEQATISALSELAGRPDVHLVDVPRPVAADLDGWELQPIVPKK